VVPLADLWLPILLASVLAFLAGFVLYLLLPLHRKDTGMLPDEAGVLARLRDAGVRPGMYLFPCPRDMREAAAPEFVARQELGPAGLLIVRPTGPVRMGPALAWMLAYHVVVSLLVAWLAGQVLGPGTAYLRVFQVTGTAAVMAYVLAVFPFAIWNGVSGRYLLTQVVDGLVWGLVTAGSFAGFWPG
jgi:hypothetical protein